MAPRGRYAGNTSRAEALSHRIRAGAARCRVLGRTRTPAMPPNIRPATPRTFRGGNRASARSREGPAEGAGPTPSLSESCGVGLEEGADGVALHAELDDPA